MPPPGKAARSCSSTPVTSLSAIVCCRAERLPRRGNTMLVLTRKEGEFLVLSKDIEIRVLRIDGDQIRIGIVAPRSVNIVRGELLTEIREETKLAAAPEAATLEN